MKNDTRYIQLEERWSVRGISHTVHNTKPVVPTGHATHTAPHKYTQHTHLTLWRKSSITGKLVNLAARRVRLWTLWMESALPGEWQKNRVNRMHDTKASSRQSHPFSSSSKALSLFACLRRRYHMYDIRHFAKHDIAEHIGYLVALVLCPFKNHCQSMFSLRLHWKSIQIGFIPKHINSAIPKSISLDKY